MRQIENVAIIPARGGSKRLPRKNIKRLCGNDSLLSISISSALASNCFEEIIVSTDCPEIAQEARRTGITIDRLRPEFLATDSASSAAVVRHEIELLESSKQAIVKNICLLQPTSPLRTSTHIQAAHQLISQSGITSVVSVSGSGLPCPASLSKFVDGANAGYRVNGAIYWFNRVHLNSMDSIYCDSGLPLLMDSSVSIDIDTMEDFLAAQKIYNAGKL